MTDNNKMLFLVVVMVVMFVSILDINNKQNIKTILTDTYDDVCIVEYDYE